MRVLSWNVGHNQGIWQTLEELRSQEQFDVALLQEATAPTESQVSRGVTPDQLDVKRWRTEISGHPRPWRTAVAWWGPLDVQPIESAPLAEVSEDDLERLPESYPGAFTAVRIGDLKLVRPVRSLGAPPWCSRLVQPRLGTPCHFQSDQTLVRRNQPADRNRWRLECVA